VTTWAVPWMLLLVLLLVAAAIAGAVILARRRRTRAKAQEDARVAEAVQEALRTKDAADQTPAVVTESVDAREPQETGAP
jgi:type II secretory pathway pseudopilin PulG